MKYVAIFIFFIALMLLVPMGLCFVDLFFFYWTDHTLSGLNYSDGARAVLAFFFVILSFMMMAISAKFVEISKEM